MLQPSLQRVFQEWYGMSPRVLEGLQSSLVTPELIAEFIAEYIAGWTRLQQEERGVAVDRARKLADVNRRIAAMLEALEQGIITPTTKERLEDLEKQ